ncbi:zinc finger protein, putative [Ricinus communis]|uniref:Zinc finger protein, putative n=1 Tax=Ricinus communis TaxID=3988 RepID=B9R7F3_RICCO|nr:zinc finger protein, putative [Ricinus communis]|eukprot:XP_002510246.1 DPH4 homolog [Ricinus communis]
MRHCKISVQETHYDILSVKEDASYEEIRTSYRLSLLNHHPDKLQSAHRTSDPQDELGDRFLKVQKAWKVLGDARSRAIYDNELRALRKDTGVAEDVSLEDMMIEDGGEALELFYQCRCGDYFSVDSLELGKMGYILLRDENKISFETTDVSPASVLLPCGSCSLQVRLLINADMKLQIDDNL